MKVIALSLGTLQTNCYILSSLQDAVVIDPAGEGERIFEVLQKEGLTLKGILLTHTHFDHFGAVDELVKKTDTLLYCPLDDASGLTDTRLNVSGFFGKGQTVKTAPSRLLKEGDKIAFGEEQLTVISTPGHTAGSCCYLSKAALFSGDTLFKHSYGRTDMPGGNKELLFSSLRRLLSTEENLKVYPGHGSDTTLDNERRYFGV